MLGKTEEGSGGGDRFGIGPWRNPRRITGSELSFSLGVYCWLWSRPAIIGGEGSPRGEEGFRVFARSDPKSTWADFENHCISLGKPYVFENKGSPFRSRFLKKLVFPNENHTFWQTRGTRVEARFHKKFVFPM